MKWFRRHRPEPRPVYHPMDPRCYLAQLDGINDDGPAINRLFADGYPLRLNGGRVFSTEPIHLASGSTVTGTTFVSPQLICEGNDITIIGTIQASALFRDNTVCPGDPGEYIAIGF